MDGQRKYKVIKKLVDENGNKNQREKDSIQKNIVAVEVARTRYPRCAYFGELEQMDATPYNQPSPSDI